MVGTGRGALAGVLIRNAEALETLEKVDTLVVDKTGTLTEGKPRLVTILPEAGSSETEILRLAAGIERASEHPLAGAIVARARELNVEPPPVEGFQSIPGEGVTGKVDGRAVALGNLKFLEKLNIRSGALKEKADALTQQVEGTDQVQMQGYQDRSKYREVVGTRYAREVILK